MAYDVSDTPAEGAVRLAGWAPGGSGLKFFKDEQEAIKWLQSSLNAGQRRVFQIQIGPVQPMKLVPQPGPYLEPEA